MPGCNHGVGLCRRPRRSAPAAVSHADEGGVGRAVLGSAGGGGGGRLARRWGLQPSPSRRGEALLQGLWPICVGLRPERRKGRCAHAPNGHTPVAGDGCFGRAFRLHSAAPGSFVGFEKVGTALAASVGFAVRVLCGAGEDLCGGKAGEGAVLGPRAKCPRVREFATACARAVAKGGPPGGPILGTVCVFAA